MEEEGLCRYGLGAFILISLDLFYFFGGGNCGSVLDIIGIKDCVTQKHFWTSVYSMV